MLILNISITVCSATLTFLQQKKTIFLNPLKNFFEKQINKQRRSSSSWKKAAQEPKATEVAENKRKKRNTQVQNNFSASVFQFKFIVTLVFCFLLL